MAPLQKRGMKAGLLAFFTLNGTGKYKSFESVVQLIYEVVRI